MELKNFSRKKIERRKTVFILSCIVTFLTVYSLVLPAITIDYDTAEEDSGIFLNENIETNNTDQNISDNRNIENDIDLIEDTEHVEPLFDISRNRFSVSFDKICPRTLSLNMFAKSSMVQPT